VPLPGPEAAQLAIYIGGCCTAPGAALLRGYSCTAVTGHPDLPGLVYISLMVTYRCRPYFLRHQAPHDSYLCFRRWRICARVLKIAGCGDSNNCLCRIFLLALPSPDRVGSGLLRGYLGWAVAPSIFSLAGGAHGAQTHPQLALWIDDVAYT